MAAQRSGGTAIAIPLDLQRAQSWRSSAGVPPAQDERRAQPAWALLQSMSRLQPDKFGEGWARLHEGRGVVAMGRVAFAMLLLSLETFGQASLPMRERPAWWAQAAAVRRESLTRRRRRT